MTTGKKVMLIGVDQAIYPLILRFVKEGVLPNLKRLIDEGASGEASPCLPCYTPTNWATLCTGSLPDTHGAGNWFNYRGGLQPADALPMSTFDSRTITAETIWEAAERAGLKSMCASYPSSYPKRTESGYIITPLHRGLVTMLMVPGAEYATNPTLPDGVVLEFKPAQGWRGAPEGSLEAVIVIQGVARSEDIVSRVGATEDGAALKPATASSEAEVRTARGVQFDLLLVDSKGQGYDHALLCDDKDATDPVAELKPGEWSPWIFRRYAVSHARGHLPVPAAYVATGVDLEGEREGSVRFKLLHLSPDGREVRLARSEVYPTTHFTDPKSLSEELVCEVGPYLEHTTAPLLPQVIEGDQEMLETILDDVRYQAMWHPRAAKYVMERYGWDIYYLHWHWPDTLNHHTLHMIEPEAPHHDPARAPAYMDVVRRSYGIMDEMVGAFMELADENTYIVVTSDHGCTPDFRIADVSRRLAEKGLIAIEGGSLDISKTQAIPIGALQIAIHLKGRSPQGTVEPEDFEKVQEEVIDALQTWRDPDGKPVLAFAVKKKDAQIFGYWGDRTGDVLFVYNDGFSWRDPAHSAHAAAFEAEPGATVVNAPPHSASHGPKLPTARTSITSNMAAFFLWGPGIRSAYSRDPDKRGFVRLLDVVPTLCHLMGFQPPRQCEGAVLWDHFEDDIYKHAGLARSQ